MGKDVKCIKWHYSPNSYLRLANKYSPFQQKLLLKVTGHLQKYIKKYFESDQFKEGKGSGEIFTEIQKTQGIDEIRLSYAELNIAPNNYWYARNELYKFVETPVSFEFYKDGKLTAKSVPLFIGAETTMGKNYITLSLNMTVFSRFFTMNKGKFISHPDDLAFTAKTEKFVSLYCLLKSRMMSWKQTSTKFNLLELKEELGLIDRDECGKIISEKYARFSSFKKRVLEPTINDLNRAKEEGKIERAFAVEYDYNGRKPIGEPTWIVFYLIKNQTEKSHHKKISENIEENSQNKEVEPRQTELQFTEEEPQYFTPYKERAPYIPEYEEMQKANPTQKAQEYESNFITDYKREVENAKKRWQDKWDSFVGHYNGRGKEILAQIKCNGISSVSIRNISVSYPDKVQKQLDKLKLTDEEWEDIASQLNKHKFVAYGILGIDRTEQGKNPAVVWRRK